MEDPPFDASIHLHTPEPEKENALQIRQLRALLEEKGDKVYVQYVGWASDEQLQKFLIARNYDTSKAYEMIMAAMKWRQKRIPVDGMESIPGWEARMSRESETGKIYIPGYDKWGRPIIILDNSVQNTTDENEHQALLAWNLEYAIKMMPQNRDKYCIFMHLEDFNVSNNPSFKCTKETIYMLCNAYPERLGHCIAYMAPTLFSYVYAAVKHLIDQKTVAKIHLITGDISDGSENDLKLKAIIGDDWKVKCGAGQPVTAFPKSSPGFNHKTYWPMAMKRLKPYVREDYRNESVEAIATMNTHYTDADADGDGDADADGDTDGDGDRQDVESSSMLQSIRSSFHGALKSVGEVSEILNPANEISEAFPPISDVKIRDSLMSMQELGEEIGDAFNSLGDMVVALGDPGVMADRTWGTNPGVNYTDTHIRSVDPVEAVPLSNTLEEVAEEGSVPSTDGNTVSRLSMKDIDTEIRESFKSMQELSTEIGVDIGDAFDTIRGMVSTLADPETFRDQTWGTHPGEIRKD